MFLAMASMAFAQSSVAGRDWSVTYIKGAKIGMIEAFVEIDATGKRFTGNSGCNIINGSVNMDRDRIRFGAFITTKRACTRETAPIENAVIAALNKGTRFTLAHDRLRLYSGRTLLAEFGPRSVDIDKDRPLNATEQLQLSDKKWVLESVRGAAVPKVGQEPFIIFDPVKGSAGGDTSCNAFGGDYKVNGSRIVITQIISTMRACIEDDRMTIEREFLDGLRSADRFIIDSEKLMLYRRDKLLLTLVGHKK